MNYLNFLYKSFIFIFFSCVIILLGFYINAYFDKPIRLNSNNNIIIYDKNENIIYNGKNDNTWVSLDNINDNLINSVISIEDKNFYKHHGFDFLRIIKAMMTNVKNKKIVEGASTISQQFIKNEYLDFEKTWSRKYKEALMTLNLETHYSKEEILEAYLNNINYSNGNIGIYKASRYYFNKKPSELTLEESILLAGIPKNPSKYNPIKNYEECKKRAQIVALSLVNNGYITKDKYDKLNFNNINVGTYESNETLNTLMYFVDATLNELNGMEKYKDLKGIKIYTSFDKDVQRTLENEINNNLDNDIQASSIIINPSDGSVISLIGGKNYVDSQFNRAIKAKRQVGSTMKPFLYYTALENGMTSSSKFLSAYTTFNIDNNKTYSPKNYGNIYGNKEISMASALSYSDNIYAVKTNLFLGTEKLIDTAKKCGINEQLKNVPSLALGTSEMTLWDFASGYTTLASGGYKRGIHIINKIEDNEGNTIYKNKKSNNLVLNPNYVYILNELLTNTTNANFIDYNTPTALNIASMLSQKYAIKTGTTNTDYLTVGYTPEKLMVMWTGYDNNDYIDVSVGTKSKIIFAKTMESINDIDSWYSTPHNIVGKIRDSITGDEVTDNNKATIYYYLKGSEPK